MSNSPATSLAASLTKEATTDRDGIHVSTALAQRTVWDELADENPTHAVISAKDEAAAAEKSRAQIADIKQHVSSDTVLLDCGAGYGRVAQYLLPEQPLQGYVAVDSSYQMLSLFKRRYEATPAEQRTPVLLVNADIHMLPLQAQSIDVAIVCAVYLHNHKDIVRQAVADLTRVMRPGGKVLVYSSFPRSRSLMGLQGQAYQILLNLLGRPYQNGPVRYYRASEIRRLFAEFAELELKPVGFAVLPKTIIGLPGPLEKLYRLGLANPVNWLLERITPSFLKPYFATHLDVVAVR